MPKVGGKLFAPPTLVGVNITTVREALAEFYPSIEYVEETGSTNADLIDAADPVDRTVLLAGHQSAGRGRKGRSFTAPPGTQLIFSVVYRPAAEVFAGPVSEVLDRLGLLPLTAGLAFSDVVAGSKLKWPNDVLVRGKKVCGILAEADGLGEDHPRIVLGCGLNVSIAPEDLPVPTATSLAIENDPLAGEGMEAVAVAVLTALERRVRQWESGSPQLLTDYRAASGTIGQAVRVETPSDTIYGVAEGIAEDGELVVVDDQGIHRTLSAGDVIHLRPWRPGQ